MPKKSRPHRLSTDEANSIIGRWRVHCRDSVFAKKKQTPPDVKEAYRVFAKERQQRIDPATTSRVVAAMNAAPKPTRTALFRLGRFDQSQLPNHAHVRVQRMKTNRKLKNEWPIVFLEVAAPGSDFVWRYKAGLRGRYYTLRRRTRGPLPKDAAFKPFPWAPIPPEALASLPPFVRSFLDTMSFGPKPE